MLTENDISKLVLDTCFRIHTKYGPRLFETVYEEIFCYGWSKTSIPFNRQYPIPLIHEEIKMEIGFRADVIIELKSIEALAPVHYKQVQTYLKLTGCKLALLVNFNVNLIKDGIHRRVNKL